MIEIVSGRNVNENYKASVEKIRSIGQRQSSRAGDVLVAPCPVMTVTERPAERVLFDPGRDANPFFHFFESLWMLTGSDNARWLDQFVRDFSSRFAEEDGHMWGAYGYRWRRNFGSDQISRVVDQLRNDSLDRRVVITMWSVSQDLFWDDLVDTAPRDLPCNTHVYPRVVDGALDLTVCCRSNDIIWGATGANAVHFSFLQEYLASQLGLEVGRMYQLSNNWHAYSDVLSRVGEPNKTSATFYEKMCSPEPISSNLRRWDDDLHHFMTNPRLTQSYHNSFFSETAWPMYQAHLRFREGRPEEAMKMAEQIHAGDWRLACATWIGRRMK